MLPADESLERADLIALEIYDRLVVNLELVPDKRLAQIGLHKAARLHLRIHLRFEEAQRAAPPTLGAVERKVGVAQQQVRTWSISDANGDADTGADNHLMPIDLIGLADLVDDALSQRGGIGRQCLEQARVFATRWPADAIFLDAYDTDAGAGAFYRKCGFREVGRVSYRKTPLIYFEWLA